MEQPLIANGGAQPNALPHQAMQYNQAPVVNASEVQHAPVQEQQSSSSVMPQQQPAAASNIPPQITPISQAQATSSNVPSNDVPQQADDVDVIEKEWVDKAKQIVEATHNDPREQEHKVSELQSDYLKKRYDKDVIVPKEER